MRNQIVKSLFLLILLSSVLFLLAFGQSKAEVYQVDISHDTLGWHVTPCPLPGFSGDTWRFTNLTTDTISLFIPICVGKQISNFYILAPEDSVDHFIGMEDWGISVRVRLYGLVDLCGRVHPPTCPTLTQWGTIALIGLLITTTVFILTKRSKQYSRSSMA